MQLQLDLSENQITLKDAPFGTVVLLADGHYIVCKPVSKLLNSTLIQEVVRRGDTIVAHLETGKLTVRKSNYPCKIVKATLSIKA